MKQLKQMGLLLGVSLISALVFMPVTTQALSGDEFQPGRIIDDALFFDGSAMTANEIQVFLNQMVPECDTMGTQPYAGTTRAAYGASRGYPPPYICLKDYQEQTVGKPSELGLCDGYTGGEQAAADIIHQVGESCGISQKVLLVLLQKEQSLVSDDWPWPIQYRSATGYGCPDSAPCNTEYYGFFNQVYNAARQFKRYVRDANNFNYRAGRYGYILYSPNVACGGSSVLIENNATAALYNYTPYQPNLAALANLYGIGDSCSSYGNRNFWRLYNDWFGPTTNVPVAFESLNKLFQQVSNGRKGQYSSVSSQIVNAQRFYESGNNTRATESLAQAIRAVQKLVDTKQISQFEGQRLVSAIESLIQTLE